MAARVEPARLELLMLAVLSAVDRKDKVEAKRAATELAEMLESVKTVVDSIPGSKRVLQEQEQDCRNIQEELQKKEDFTRAFLERLDAGSSR
eukprot:m51a1_g2558 hypothetical protein (92) ;mRNA; r:329783-330247